MDRKGLGRRPIAGGKAGARFRAAAGGRAGARARAAAGGKAGATKPECLKRRQDEPAPRRDPLQDGVVTVNSREHDPSPCAPAFRHRPWRFPAQYGTGLNGRTVSDELAQFDDEYRASR